MAYRAVWRWTCSDQATFARLSPCLARVALAAGLPLGRGAMGAGRRSAGVLSAGDRRHPGAGQARCRPRCWRAVAFWGTQGVFEHVKGVRQVLAGYSGGERSTADYGTVSTGTTGHAESIQITFDPAVVSYAEMLRVFFSVAHDPTELNRQGPDEGTQYRSEIFYADATQQKIALAYIAQLHRRTCLAPDCHARRSAAGASIRRKAIIRIFWSETRTIPTSSSTICRRSRI